MAPLSEFTNRRDHDHFVYIVQKDLENLREFCRSPLPTTLLFNHLITKHLSDGSNTPGIEKLYEIVPEMRFFIEKWPRLGAGVATATTLSGAVVIDRYSKHKSFAIHRVLLYSPTLFIIIVIVTTFGFAKCLLVVSLIDIFASGLSNLKSMHPVPLVTSWVNWTLGGGLRDPSLWNG
ncbi:hypothetical protein M426DRAFT_10372 [Hypoxylon sp. CI-4A]|nr:hypothetical protein M426DRAFT_10372 [Hypoxylon sp. CI-4A]